MEDPHPPGSGEIACVPALKDSPSDREIVIQTVSSLARTKVLTVLPGEEIPRGQEASILGRGACAVVARNSLPPLLRRYFLSFSEGEKKFFQISNRALSLLSEENPTLDLLRVRDHRCCLKRKYRKNRRTALECTRYRVKNGGFSITRRRYACTYIYIYKMFNHFVQPCTPMMSALFLPGKRSSTDKSRRGAGRK